MASHRKGPVKGKKLKGIAAGAAILSLFAMGSVATVSAFTDTADTKITVAAGTIDLQLDNVKTLTIPLGSTIKPGDVIPTKTITVANKGTIALNYTVKTAAAGSGTLASALDVTVTQGATAGVKTKLNAVNRTVRTIAPGATEVVKLDVVWPSTGLDNTFQGASGNVTLDFAATS